MTYDNPYDEAQDRAEREDLEERRRDAAEEEEIERWKMARFESPEMQARSIIADDDCGYDMADPKHPTWLERQRDHADLLNEEN